MGNWVSGLMATPISSPTFRPRTRLVQDLAIVFLVLRTIDRDSLADARNSQVADDESRDAVTTAPKHHLIQRRDPLGYLDQDAQQSIRDLPPGLGRGTSPGATSGRLPGGERGRLAEVVDIERC
jgi:hypothetical protein